ncbi:adenine nucleotide alpha-hydrolase family protein [Paracoccus zhejiangensis]|uniref:Adenine nucleotide alpha hydrolase n=1 Tax=Paracoccus zhejiangensis TaxID=1077935 RepID=A0A2H5F2K5_9RHOB|nr:adenine nucleotide alpha hydrolase [Paracoccus zhejiangensis]AUH65757.1 adenine nucleotide alpha hydrolase [Paracoccus zhejiangensis]
MTQADDPAARLRAILTSQPGLALAVSGGVDSLTLAHGVARLAGQVPRVFHAVSPAVPVEATARVRRHAEAHGWQLTVIEAGEFADPDYLRNPVNRCYFCKSNLYARIAGATDATIASGANLDDLGDYRPGLTAASERQVIHPFVLAGMGKAEIRRMAAGFGLSDVQDLPAQPCLASRIETGLPVRADDLAFVARVEAALTTLAGPGDHRCRITAEGVRIELQPELLQDAALIARLTAEATRLCGADHRILTTIGPYRRGSAFLHDQ